MSEILHLRRERDLLARLLSGPGAGEPEAFLREALGLVLERTAARRGYLALYPEGGRPDQPRWWWAIDCEDLDVARIHRSMSKGVVAAALREGKTIRLINAMLDPTWGQRESIRRNNVEAVVCAPIGGAEAFGVLYLQGRQGSGGFSEIDVSAVDELCRWLAPSARRFLDSQSDGDPAQAIRDRIDVSDLLGPSVAMSGVLRQIELASRFQIDVLITGPTGSGKSAIARAIARNSARADRPFIEVNCGAIPPALFEAQMFGVAPGAFTGASPRGADGFVQAAEGGTLFLDEIGELSAAGQAALLQFLPERLSRRVGETAARRADLRVIAATNRDLQAAVTEGRFRQDLLHRLDTLSIRAPALEERPEDVPVIARSVLRRLARQHGVPPLELTFAARLRLATTPWPGNVRQLEKALEVSLLRATMSGRTELGLDELFPGERPAPADGTWQDATRAFQRRLLMTALQEADGNVSAAARSLGLARSRVYELLEQHGLRGSSDDA